MSFRYKLLAIVSAVVLLLDQATKLHIEYHFRLYESVTVIENFFNIVHVRNQGAAFGFLSDSPFRLPFFILVATVAAGGIIWYLAKHVREDQRLLQLALSLIFGGAIGNLIDRVRLGEVVDFIDVHWHQYHWPAFNVADSAITVGVALLLIDMWREERRGRKQSSPDRP